MSQFLAGWLPEFPLQAALRAAHRAGAGGAQLVWERQGPLRVVVAANAAARAAGVGLGMAVTQAQGRCPGVALLEREAEAERVLTARLLQAADRIAPRVEAVGADLVLVDLAGLRHQPLPARRLQSLLAGLRVRTGLAAQPALALLAAKSGLESIPEGQERAAVAPLPLTLLAQLGELTRLQPGELDELLSLCRRWGLRSFGDLAQLPSAALAARLGQAGTRLQAIARGEAAALLQPLPPPPEPLAHRMEFDPPVEDLEIVVGAAAQAVAALAPVLDGRDQVVEQCELELDTRPRPLVFTRTLAPPTRDRHSLETQLETGLRQQPPSAPVSGLCLRYAVARPRRMQTSLFAPPAAEREKLPHLLARLARTGASVGSPRLLDSHHPRAFAMRPFAPEANQTKRVPANDLSAAEDETKPVLGLRIFRPPRAFDPAHARILRRAGPWRSRGGWWHEAMDPNQWAWDEWDIELPTGLYRLGHDLLSSAWYLVGQYD